MHAKFENNPFSDTLHTSACKYKSLQNLPHWHMEYELIYVFDGTARVLINNNGYELKKHMCVFVNSREIHYIKGEQNSVIGVIKTNAVYVKHIAETRRLACPLLKGQYDADRIFLEISEDLKQNKPFKEIVADCAVSSLIARIFQNETTVEAGKSVLKNTERYKELLDIILKEYANITFEKAAEFMNFNPSYFSRYFYKCSGMTFTDYLNTIRVSAAIEKIAEGKMSMTEISIACGFGTIRNFNRVFKKCTGYSPKQLPDDYVYIHNFKDMRKTGFDPTLNCTKLLE